MSRRLELLDRAADCERLMRVTSDPNRWAVYRMLRDILVALSSDSSISDQQLMTEISAIDEIQAKLRKTMH